MTTIMLPHWDLTALYSGLDDPAFAAEFAAVTAAIGETTALFDRLGVAKRELAPLTDGDVTAFVQAVGSFDPLLTRVYTLHAYIYSFVSTDSRDAAAQARLSELMRELVAVSQLGTRFTAWIGGLDVEALIVRSRLAYEHRYALRRAQIEAQHLMSPAEEALASELTLTGSSAWTRLHGNLSSQLLVPIVLDGEASELPMSAIRNLAFDPNRATRKAAYEAEIAAWERSALPLAAALNGIKGEVIAIERRRNWEDPLDAAAFNNSIDRQTLDAMMTAAHEFFPEFRRYLRAKATLLGTETLPWYDMFAPVGGSSRSWDYDAACSYIVANFSKYSEKLGAFAARAFESDWVDAEPRAGKAGGAFCMWLRGDESRILTNYKPSIEGVQTLAHELGHAYHNFNLAGQTMLNRDTPMTLAETASIFCETIVRDAAMANADADEQLEILEASIQGSCQVVVDITSRFLFEQRVFAGRADRELSVQELNELMLQSQRETYGDGLDSDMLHPYMWAVKGHYYSSSSFYNFPYMFGLLFGLGLYAIYQRDPDSFRDGYDTLLASTGLSDAATLAAGMGIDIRSVDFWRGSLGIVKADIDRFEALAAA